MDAEFLWGLGHGNAFAACKRANAPQGVIERHQSYATAKKHLPWYRYRTATTALTDALFSRKAFLSTERFFGWRFLAGLELLDYICKSKRMHVLDSHRIQYSIEVVGFVLHDTGMKPFNNPVNRTA